MSVRRIALATAVAAVSLSLAACMGFGQRGRATTYASQPSAPTVCCLHGTHGVDAAQMQAAQYGGQWGQQPYGGYAAPQQQDPYANPYGGYAPQQAPQQGYSPYGAYPAAQPYGAQQPQWGYMPMGQGQATSPYGVVPTGAPQPAYQPNTGNPQR